MNRIWVVACYEKEPGSQVQSDLMARMTTIMKQMFPQSKIGIETKPGCWWLIVTVTCAKGGAWLLDVLGRWGVMRVLDHFATRRKEDIGLPGPESADSMATTDGGQLEPSQTTVSFDDKFSQYVAIARELKRDAPPLQVLNIAEWNDERKEGVLLQVRLYEETEAMNIVKCRNIEDLQKLMRP